MKNLKKEIEKLFAYELEPDYWVFHKDRMGDLIKLFRYWVDDRVLIKLRLIRANPPLSEPHCAEAREKLKAVIEDVEEATK